MTSNCLFCKIINKEIPAEFIYENENSLVFKDINPVAPTHLLVIPKKHFSSLKDLDSISSSQIIQCIQELTFKLGITDFRSVFNTGAKAGQSVFHVHAHVIAGRELDWPPG